MRQRKALAVVDGQTHRVAACGCACNYFFLLRAVYPAFAALQGKLDRCGQQVVAVHGFQLRQTVAALRQVFKTVLARVVANTLGRPGHGTLVVVKRRINFVAVQLFQLELHAVQQFGFVAVLVKALFGDSQLIHRRHLRVGQDKRCRINIFRYGFRFAVNLVIIVTQFQRAARCGVIVFSRCRFHHAVLIIGIVIVADVIGIHAGERVCPRSILQFNCRVLHIFPVRITRTALMAALQFDPNRFRQAGDKLLTFGILPCLFYSNSDRLVCRVGEHHPNAGYRVAVRARRVCNNSAVGFVAAY